MLSSQSARFTLVYRLALRTFAVDLPLMLNITVLLALPHIPRCCAFFSTIFRKFSFLPINLLTHSSAYLCCLHRTRRMSLMSFSPHLPQISSILCVVP